MRSVRNTYKFFVEKRERKRSFGRSRRRWAYNIKMHLKDIIWKAMHLIHITRDRAGWHFWRHWISVWINSGEFLSFSKTISFSRRTLLCRVGSCFGIIFALGVNIYIQLQFVLQTYKCCSHLTLLVAEEHYLFLGFPLFFLVFIPFPWKLDDISYLLQYSKSGSN